VQVRVSAGGNDRVERLLLTEPEARLELPADCDAVLVNEGGHGFYRVRYSPDLLARLLRRMPAGLAAIERFNLVNDSWAAALAGLMPLAGYLDLTAHSRGERDKNVWAVLTGSLAALNRLIVAEDRPRLAALVRDRASPAATELGWAPRTGEDELTRQLRGDLLRTLGTLGEDAAVQARAAEAYARYLREPAVVDANVLAAAIPVLAHAGGRARYDEFLERFRAARTPQEEQRFLYALAAFREPALLEETLTRTLNGEVRTQDAPYVLRSLLLSVYGRRLAWTFVKENWERINREFPVTGVRRMCEGVTGLATPEEERDVRQFFAARQADLGGKTLDQYLEQLHVAVRLREREGPALHQYLGRFPK
jgi:puromycin-sensitive aminopeptidase